MDQFTWPFQFLVCFLLYQVSAASSPTLSSFASPAHSLCRHEQRSALLQFKHMFTITTDPTVASASCDFQGIPSYPKTSYWSTEGNATDCCSWDGVTCDGVTGDVIALDLSCSQLYGTISPNSSLFQLSHLQRLNLAYNNFELSPISYEFGNFASLTHLNLAGSGFSGSIPSEISHLSKLISLDLSSRIFQNPLSLELLNFKIILQNLTQLQELILPLLNISSVFPDSLLNLTSLTTLNLLSTGLRGNLPDGVFHLPNLQRLNLGGNNDLVINFPKSTWRSGSSLKVLDLSRTRLSGRLPALIGNLKSLKSLDLSWTILSGELPNSIGYLYSLNYLDLSKTSLSGELPNSIGNLYSLNYLDLSWTSLSGELPNSIGYLYSLNYLNLNWTSLSGELPNSIGDLYSLNYLDLFQTNLSGALPNSICNLYSLNYLDLSNTGLSGELPNSIGDLYSLNYLNLSCTDLSGELPNSISNLYSLNYLDLNFCKFQGSIPKSLGNLTQIRELLMSFNSFSGEIPSILSNLTQLATLELSFNYFKGRIPVLAELTMLESLDVSHNSLTGFIPPSMFALPSLTRLDMSSNCLIGPILDEFDHPLPLEFIDLSNNKLHGPIPQSISNLVNLTTLYLSSNDLSSVVNLQVPKNPLSSTNLSEVSRGNDNITLPNLTYLRMSSCNIEVFPSFLRTSEHLQDLDLSQNRIRGEIPNWDAFHRETFFFFNVSHNFLTSTKHLPQNLLILDLSSNLLQGPLPIPPSTAAFFFISNNSLSGEIPSLICNTHLEILDMSHNKMSGAVPQCLGNFSTFLTVLNLRSNGFTGTLPSAFATYILRSLDFSGNQFEGPLPRSLADCEYLEVLNVANNMIADTFPHWLENLPRLQVLVIRSNIFHGPINISKRVTSFPMLRIIDISSNQFNGHLPAKYFEYFQAMKKNTLPEEQYMYDPVSEYYADVIVRVKGRDMEMTRILTIFTMIDFSANNFSGEIPNVIGNLIYLKGLNFSHNSLTGHIPLSLGDLKNLESLDISSNQLTGKIPSQLTDLTFLSVLNLSWNHLHGPIPQGRQFNTFENVSYVGNSGLCGFPLTKECGASNRTKVQPVVLLQEEDDSEFNGFFWKVVAVGYGCGMALGLFLGTLMFLIGRPQFFVRLVERKRPRKVVRLRKMVTDTVARRK